MGRSLKQVFQCHLFYNILCMERISVKGYPDGRWRGWGVTDRIGHHLDELVKAKLAISILVRLHDRLVHDLLQLLVLEVAADHHLEHDEELAVADVAVAVDVVDLEGELELLLLVALAGEGAQPGDELLEVDIAAAILVEDSDEPECLSADALALSPPLSSPDGLVIAPSG